MGTTDRIIRGIIGIALLLVSLLVLDGTWQIVLLVISGILIGTATSGVCLLYIPFHISTKKKR
jgi:phosphate/sulfate permease